MSRPTERELEASEHQKSSSNAPIRPPVRCALSRLTEPGPDSFRSSSSPAIDIWSVGIILLSFLSRKFPIFNSNDDTEALMEISAIFGKARMDKCAAIHNRTFLSNLPSIDHDGHTLEAVILVSNPDLWNHKAFPAPKPLFLDDPFYDPPPGETQHRAEISQALDLLKRCLALDPCKRITATDALLHPWLRRPGIDENKDGPRKPTEGVCRRKHKIDEYGVREFPFLSIDDHL